MSVELLQENPDIAKAVKELIKEGVIKARLYLLLNLRHHGYLKRRDGVVSRFKGE